VLYRNAALVPQARLRLARLIVDEHWPTRRAAERFQVYFSTAKRWAERLDEERAAGVREAQLDRRGLPDRSSRPHRRPRRTSKRQTKRVLRLRRCGWGPEHIGPYLRMPASTVAKILRRERMPPAV
jgi:transposase